MTNLDNLYTKNFTWKIDGVLALPEPEFKNGSYLESETFRAAKDVQWCLRLYPRGEDADSKKFISIFLHLLDGNGSEEVRANCKFSIVNERGTKLNKQETSFCVHTLHGDTDYNGWGFHKFIGRDTLATTNNYIVHGHQLIVDCQIEIKKDMKLIEARNEKRRLRMKIAELEQKLKKETKDKDDIIKQNLNKEIKEKEEHVKFLRELNKEVKEKDELLQNLKNELKDKDKLVQNLKKETKEKDEMVQNLKKELKEKDGIVQNLKTYAKKKHDKLVKMREMLEETACEEHQQEINNSPTYAGNASETVLPSPAAENIPSGGGNLAVPLKMASNRQISRYNNSTKLEEEDGERPKKMRLSDE